MNAMLFVQWLVIAYLMTLGFNLIFFQKRGWSMTNRFWGVMIRSVMGFVFRTFGDILHWVAKRVRG